MAVRERCWTLVRRLVLVLVLVKVVGAAGPLTAGLRVIPSTYSVDTDLATDSDYSTSSTAIPSTSSGATSSSTAAPVTSSVPTSTAASAPVTSSVPTTATPAHVTSSEPTSATPGMFCPDPHAEWNDREGECVCFGRYRTTSDPERSDNNTCRISGTGYLGTPCNDVSDCNYQISHVACDRTCQCINPYVGFKGETTCFDNAMGWGVAIKTAGITVLVLAVGFCIAFGIKGCSNNIRRRLGRRVPWMRRTSDISFNSGDFFLGGLSQAILDRPPSYAEEDNDKPPAYEEVFPEQDGVVNAGFTPDSGSESPERTRRQQRRQQQEPAPAEAVPLPAVTVLPERPTASRSAVRGHRRGLSGPAAIHLGTADQTDGSQQTDRAAALEQTHRTAAPGQTDRTAAPGQTDRTAAAEQTDRTATPEQTDRTAAPEQMNRTATSEQTDKTATPEQTNRAEAPQQTNRQITSVKGPSQAAGSSGTRARHSDQLAGTSGGSQAVEVEVNVPAAVQTHPPESARVREGRQSAAAANQDGQGPHRAQNHSDERGEQREQCHSSEQGAAAGPCVQLAGRGDRDAPVEQEEVWEDIRL